LLLTKICTGISGFDDLFDGGIIAGNTVLVEGIPGAGKTTLGVEFIYRGIRDFGDPGLVLTFEQFPESLYRDARSLGWDLEALEKENKLRVICTSPDVVLRPDTSFLEEAARSIGAKRVLVDSVSHFRQVVHHSLKLRQAVYSFCNGLRRLGLTSFLIKELEGDIVTITVNPKDCHPCCCRCRGTAPVYVFFLEAGLTGRAIFIFRCCQSSAQFYTITLFS
jgi:circadian clock protein KaiC